MIFPVLKLEAKVQTNEKTRLDGTKSYTSIDEAAVSLVRIKPDSSDPYITVATGANATNSELWYLDWQYSSSGTKHPEIEITTNATPSTYTVDITVANPNAEKLFSSDTDLIAEEPDILKYVKDGKNSFNDFHRVAQEKIMDEIYRQRIFNTDGNKLTIDEVLDTVELKQWSKYMVLKLIFESMSNKVDDIFSVKSTKYAQFEQKAFNECMNQMRLDYNKDGELNKADEFDFRSVELIRR